MTTFLANKKMMQIVFKQMRFHHEFIIKSLLVLVMMHMVVIMLRILSDGGQFGPYLSFTISEIDSTSLHIVTLLWGIVVGGLILNERNRQQLTSLVSTRMALFISSLLAMGILAVVGTGFIFLDMQLYHLYFNYSGLDNLFIRRIDWLLMFQVVTSIGLSIFFVMCFIFTCNLLIRSNFLLGIVLFTLLLICLTFFLTEGVVGSYTQTMVIQLLAVMVLLLISYRAIKHLEVSS